MKSKNSDNSQHRVRTPIRESNRKKFQDSEGVSVKTPRVSSPEYVQHTQPGESQSTTTQKLLSLAIIILIFIALIVGVFFLFNFLLDNTNSDDFMENENENSSLQSRDFVSQFVENNTNESQDDVILVVTNEDCEFCQVEDLNEDVSQLFESVNISTNYSFVSVNVNSNISKEIFAHFNNESINYKFTPLYVFPSQIEEVRGFSPDLFSSLFSPITNSTNYYLNPENIGVRYLNEQFELPNSTITIGNTNATPITIMNDYWCKRCQIINGDASTIAQAQEEGIISQNYSAPISQLLLAIKSVESQEDLSFHINYIPSPTSSESEQLQKMNYCAHNQGLFIELHVLLVESIKNSQDPIIFNDSQIMELTQMSGLNSEEFITCLNSQEAENFKDDMNSFLRREEVTSLPFIIVGNYPLLEVIDSQILSLLLESENQVFNN